MPSRLLSCLVASLLCVGLSGCFVYRSVANLPRDAAILTDHARAKAALARGDVEAAEGFLTGKAFRHRAREVAGTSWGELGAQAADLVLAAHARGAPIDPEALFEANMVMGRSDDLPVALAFLDTAQRLLDAGGLSDPADKRRHLFDQRFPVLLLVRYLEAGGRIDWNTEIVQGFHELSFRSPPARPGEHDPRDFYRFLLYLTPEDRDWLFAHRRPRVPLDPAVAHDEAALHAFSHSLAYYHWFDDNGFEGLLAYALNDMSRDQAICIARARGYDVVARGEDDRPPPVDAARCRMPRVP